MFPFYNLMNLDDAIAQLILTPVKAAEVQTALHGLWLSANQDLSYSGRGAFDDKIFGYVGRPSTGRSYLGRLLDCQLNWKINGHVSTTLYYGHVSGGSVISPLFPGGKEADYGFIESLFSL